MKNADSRLTVITFELAGAMLAIDAAHLQEVIEPVAVSPLPFVPPFIDGLVNVNGQILPQINLSAFMAKDADALPTNSMDTLLVVDLHKTQLVLKVGQVFEPCDIDVDAIHAVDDNPAVRWQPEMLSGTVDYLQQHLLLVNVQTLERIVSQRQAAPAVGETPGFLGKASDRELEQQTLLDYLLVEYQQRTYAFELDEVKEVLDISTYNELHRGEDWVLGVSLVHETPVLLLQLAGLLHDDTVNAVSDNTRMLHVLLVQAEGVYCGLVVDAVKGLCQVREDQLLIDKRAEHPTLQFDDGQMVEVLPVASLLNEDIRAHIEPWQPNLRERQQIQQIPTREYLRFFIDNDAYAIEIHAIQRIVGLKQLTPLLDEHGFVLGTIELEGYVLPVIDLDLQLGYRSQGVDGSEYTEYVIIDDDEGYSWALAINHTDDIVHVPEPAIDSLLTTDSLISAYARFDTQLISVLNLPTLCRQNIRPERVTA
ncbi:Chemotaxis protein CheV [BD1-7 clade bacterium]|uniref:Chemotaxis protein CheV n=1 Tax=BD1-7 clade bacterium TaxID=2029982 RepID=A0A5S9MVS1_9GAMM|nr:Chemotaxis protein CheV [BD1-7 clade bacterium]CAA0083456.1 Chemotaxis protein CheV [BD1-7 clade bacterium]